MLRTLKVGRISGTVWSRGFQHHQDPSCFSSRNSELGLPLRFRPQTRFPPKLAVGTAGLTATASRLPRQGRPLRPRSPSESSWHRRARRWVWWLCLSWSKRQPDAGACPLETGGEPASPKPRGSPRRNHSVFTRESGKTGTAGDGHTRCPQRGVRPQAVFGEKHGHRSHTPRRRTNLILF